MNIGVISLLALVVAIILGFTRKSNVGILCMGLAMIIGVFGGIDGKEIIAGFSSSLCIQMLGIMYFFAIISENGTLTIIANKVVRMVGARHYLIPIVMFVMGYVLCAVGPGAIPTLTIIPVLAIPIAITAGLNPVMVGAIGQMGVQAGRMSPLTPDAAVVSSLMAEQNISGSTMTVGLCMLATDVIMSILVYIYYKGWKVKKVQISTEAKDESAYTLHKENIISLIALVFVIVGVLAFSLNVGLAGFLAGSILIVIGIGDEKKAVKAISWNTVLMVLGVGVLMNIISLSGGINILVEVLENIMGPKTASAILSLVAAILSFFSSGLGVVFPTFIPTAGHLAGSFGINSLELTAAVVVGGTYTGLSPISSAGALVMASVAQEKDSEKKYPQNKIFVELFGIAFVGMLVTFLLALTGVYGLICR